MIRFLICDAVARKQVDGRWYVVHPSGGSLLAVASTEAAALRAVNAINDMARLLRSTGEQVAT